MSPWSLMDPERKSDQESRVAVWQKGNLRATVYHEVAVLIDTSISYGMCLLNSYEHLSCW